MDLKPGDVVILKSGGHPLSVVEVKDDKVACVWMGNAILPIASLPQPNLVAPDLPTLARK